MLAPVVLLTTGACVATRQDLRVLQQDLQTVRAEVARRDSTRAAQLAAATAQEAQSLRALADSVRLLSARVNREAAENRETLYKIEQQLLVIQELTGQTQRRIQEFKSEIEQRTDRQRQDGDTTAAGGAAGEPGPNQLLDLALGQLRRNSPASARAGFQDILQRFPTSSVADLAQFHLGEAWQAEGNLAEADAAFVATYTRYPTSPKAPTAMYKHALILQQQGKAPQARAALEEVVRKYPRSDEAELARGRLRAR